MEEKEDLGSVTVGYGASEQRDIEVKDCAQIIFPDGKIVSVRGVCDKSIVFSVENPPNSELNNISTIWLSKESAIGMIHAALLYFHAKNEDIGSSLKSMEGYDKIEYALSKSLKPSI